MPTVVSNTTGMDTALWTADDFLEWLQPGVHADLIDGEKMMHSPVSLHLARLINFLDEFLRRWLRANGVRGELFREVVAVKLGQRNVFLPDLCWFTEEQAAGFPRTHAVGPPRWVCEVLSPRMVDRDTGPRFAAYEEHGVEEYWILDPDRLSHRFYATDGEYLTEFADGEGEIRSRVFDGLVLRRDWLDPKALPDVDACLREAGPKS